MKRQKLYGLIFCIMVTILMPVVFTGCSSEKTKKELQLKDGQTDSSYVQEKKTLVVGVTDFLPLDYKENDKWVGFDAELAEKFAENLGVKAEIKEISWEEKTELLNQGEIDCIWNGMTLTEELAKQISCSKPYLFNAQVIVLPKENNEQYSSIEDCQHLLFAVEAGSAGESLIKEKKYRYASYDNQKKAMQAVSQKKADAAIVDLIMAGYCTKQEKEFENLAFGIVLNDEQIGIGFRKESDLVKKADEFIETVYKDGTIQKLAEKYGVSNALMQ